MYVPISKCMTFEKVNPFHARYGRDDIPLPEQQPTAHITKLLTRRSVRRFSNRELPNGTLELLVAAAQSAPTSGMLQTWSVISLDQKAKENFINALWETPGHAGILGGVDTANYTAIGTSKIFLIWLADLSKLDFILQNNNIDEEIKYATNTAEYHLKAIVDATIAAQTFFGAAESMGISGTYIGAVRQLPIDFLKTYFNLPPHTFPLFATVHGISAEAVTQGKNGVRWRMGQDLVLHHSKYTSITDNSQFDEYNRIHAEMQKGMPQSTVSGSFVSRVAERLKPTMAKARIGDSLKQMGFTFE